MAWIQPVTFGESRRPGVREVVDTDPRDFANDADAPWPVRRGGWIRVCMSIRSGRRYRNLCMRRMVRQDVERDHDGHRRD
jgi:hypothetical protein